MKYKRIYFVINFYSYSKNFCFCNCFKAFWLVTLERALCNFTQKDFPGPLVWIFFCQNTLIDSTSKYSICNQNKSSQGWIKREFEWWFAHHFDIYFIYSYFCELATFSFMHGIKQIEIRIHISSSLVCRILHCKAI